MTAVPIYSRPRYGETPTNHLLASLFVRLTETPGEWELVELLDHSRTARPSTWRRGPAP